MTTLPHIDGLRLRRCIGEGGTVYLAVETSSGRRVAVKRATCKYTTPSAAARFAAELDAVRRIRHRNVIRLRASGEADGVRYSVFEYVAGVDLAQVGPMSWQVAAHVAWQLARAVAAVHAAGMLHRDLKPSNVMVDERMTAAVAACLPLPPQLDATAAAPLLCAGLIGWRTLRMAGDAQRIGIFGFGAAAHLVAQVIRWQGRRFYAFTRPGDHARQAHACALGAVWAGGSDERSPELLDAALLFADAGEGEIHMSDIPSFPYDLLWREKVVRSVANLTRRDGVELLDVAARIPLRPDVTAYPLERVEQAIAELRGGRVRGAAVVTLG